MLSPAETRHLLLRTGFSAPQSEQAKLQALSREQAVDHLLNRKTSQLKVPEVFLAPPPTASERKKLSQGNQGKAFRQQRNQLGMEIKAWWYRQALSNSNPLHEQMVLLWHNHFTSSMRKVGWPPLLFKQHLVVREHAMGSFADLLAAMLQDVALLRYLDNQRNRKQAPNENLARELLELFTLGEGQYSEQDIRELARALTGAGHDQQGQYRFRRRQHDSGTKQLLGHSGKFQPDDIPDLLLAQPRCAEYLSEKLWCHFVSIEPDPAAIQQLASVLRENQYQVRPWLTALLLSDAFWDPANQAALIRSPLELMIALGQGLQLPALDQQSFLKISRSLGQDLFDPPNVKGWPTGLDQINSVTLINRQDLLTQSATLAFERSQYSSPLPDPAAILAKDPLLAKQTGFDPLVEDHWQQLLIDPVLHLK